VSAPVETVGGAVDLTCTVCGNEFEHAGGRGRRPKRCPDCRTVPAASSSSNETAPKRPRGIESLKQNLHTQLTMLGAGVCLVDKFDGTHIMKHAQQGAEVIANLAATNPSIRAGLEKGVELAGWGPVILWLTGMALPIMAHHGLLQGVEDPALKTTRQQAPDGAV
jgi:phage FluMu protein Com